MKKGLFIILLVIVCATQANAQNFIVQWQGGYAWQPGSTQPIPAQLFNTQTPTLDQWTNLANVNEPTNYNKTINNSYGHGVNLSLQVGYMFNPYIGITLGISYQKSKLISASQVNTLYYPDTTNGPIVPTGGYVSSAITTQSQNLTLSPSVIFQYNKPKFKFYPYLRAGLTLPVFTIIQQHVDMNVEGAGSADEAPYFLGLITSTGLETYTNFSMGVNGAIGVCYKAYPFLHFFIEVNAQYLNMKGDFSQYTEWIADGIDYNGTGGRGVYRSIFEYVKTLNSSSNNAAYNPNYNPNNPKQEISPNFPFSYIGFNVGVKLSLNKKVFKDKDMFQENLEIQNAKKTAKKKKAAESNKPDSTTPTTPPNPATPH